MAEYIEREAAINAVRDWLGYKKMSADIASRGLKTVPAADVAPVAELEKTRRALACMWFAYINKDEELPHEFEKKAEEMAEELLGPFNGYVMTYLLKEDENETD